MTGRGSARMSLLSAIALATASCTTSHVTAHAPNSASSTTPAAAPSLVRTIPWRALPAVVNSRFQTGYTLPAGSQRGRPCRLSDLAVVPFGGGAGGTFYARTFVHNVSTQTCWLPGRPEIELIDTAGRIFQSTGPDRMHRPVQRVILVPNSWALADLGAIASDTCGGDQTTTLRITLPRQSASRSLHFPVGRPPDPADCGGRITGATPHPNELQVGPFQPIPKPQNDFLLIRHLVPHLQAPRQVHAGQTLTFTVEFTNPDVNSSGIDNDPCPIFQMTLAPTTASGTYLLPCKPIISIPPGATLAYQMRLAVPSDATPGPATLRWQLREPDEPPLVAHVTIDG